VLPFPERDLRAGANDDGATQRRPGGLSYEFPLDEAVRDDETGAASEQVRSAAVDLSRTSEKLRAEIDAFLARIRAA
jgi:hypothetical protein